MFFKTALLLAAATAVLGSPARIIGGTPVALGEVAYMVSLQDRDNQHYCGGVIINPTTVLTAASCIAGFDLQDGRVIVGTIDVADDSQRFNANRLRVHPDYVTVNGIPTHDIALLRVDQPFIYSSTTGRAFLPTQDYAIAAETNCTVAGWGTTAFGGAMSDFLMKVSVPIIDKLDCADAYADLTGLPINQICAGLPEGGADACDRDVGGPLFENGVVYGLFSWGGRCGEPGRPGVYTEVSAYRDWIDANSD